MVAQNNDLCHCGCLWIQSDAPNKHDNVMCSKNKSVLFLYELKKQVKHWSVMLYFPQNVAIFSVTITYNSNQANYLFV